MEGVLRCLRLPAMAALNTCQPPHMLLTTLLPATRLAADVQAKLKLLIGRARRPPGLMAPPAAQAAAAPGAGGLLCGPAQLPAGAGGPTCLHGVGLTQLVQQLVPLLPALHKHIATALSVLRQPPSGGWEVLHEGGWWGPRRHGSSRAPAACTRGAPTSYGCCQLLPTACRPAWWHG